MFRSCICLLLVVAVYCNNSSCGPSNPSKILDCQMKDLGSCGNACCTLSLTVDATPDSLYTSVTNFLKTGGSDNSYSYRTGPDAAGHNPSDDLRPFNLNFKYIFQGTHNTTGGYVDVLDFNIQQDSNKKSVITMFSSSGIHGALGDNGQNFKNLAFLSRSLEWKPKFVVVHGCGKKQSNFQQW